MTSAVPAQAPEIAPYTSEARAYRLRPRVYVLDDDEYGRLAATQFARSARTRASGRRTGQLGRAIADAKRRRS